MAFTLPVIKLGTFLYIITLSILDPIVFGFNWVFESGSRKTKKCLRNIKVIWCFEERDVFPGEFEASGAWKSLMWPYKKYIYCIFQVVLLLSYGTIQSFQKIRKHVVFDNWPDQFILIVALGNVFLVKNNNYYLLSFRKNSDGAQTGRVFSQ